MLKTVNIMKKTIRTLIGNRTLKVLSVCLACFISVSTFAFSSNIQDASSFARAVRKSAQINAAKNVTRHTEIAKAVEIFKKFEAEKRKDRQFRKIKEDLAKMRRVRSVEIHINKVDELNRLAKKENAGKFRNLIARINPDVSKSLSSIINGGDVLLDLIPECSLTEKAKIETQVSGKEEVKAIRFLLHNLKTNLSGTSVVNELGISERTYFFDSPFSVNDIQYLAVITDIRKLRESYVRLKKKFQAELRYAADYAARDVYRELIELLDLHITLIDEVEDKIQRRKPWNRFLVGTRVEDGSSVGKAVSRKTTVKNLTHFVRGYYRTDCDDKLLIKEVPDLLKWWVEIARSDFWRGGFLSKSMTTTTAVPA